MVRIHILPQSSKIVTLCSIANFINAADRVLMPIAIIPMTDEFKWNLHWQGWILSTFAIGYFISQVLGSFSAGKFGGKVVLLCAVLLWSFSTLVTPMVAPSSVMALVICRFALGLGEGLGLPTTYHILAHSVPIEERSRAFAYLVAAGSVGQTIASVVCPHIAWQTSFYVLGSAGLAWSILWVVMYTETRVPTAPNPEQLPFFHTDKKAEEQQKSWVWHSTWFLLLSHWPLWSIYIAHFAMNWSSYIIMQWLPTYLTRTLGANRESISLSAVPYIFNFIVGIGAGHWADKLVANGWPLLSVRRLMTSLGLIGPGLFLLAFCAVNNLAAAVILVSISMGFCAFNSAGHLSNHADVAPNHAGITFALSNTLATIPGILCGPVTAELVTASQGRWFPVFVLASGINFTAAVIYHSQSSASQII